DALCTNQQSDVERNHQVGMMRDIYSGSIQTLIWLGEETEESKSGLSLRMTENELKMPAVHTILSEDRSKTFASIFARPWFERAWVIQEVV
ncbi:heterokaryon incompatibility, partial [Lepidopterella palustris CBS 459.81]